MHEKQSRGTHSVRSAGRGLPVYSETFRIPTISAFEILSGVLSMREIHRCIFAFSRLRVQTPLTHSDRLSLGFRALRYLNERIAFADKLGVPTDGLARVMSRPPLPPAGNEVRCTERLAPGTVLLAHPLLPGGFARRIILIVEHGTHAYVQLPQLRLCCGVPARRARLRS